MEKWLTRDIDNTLKDIANKIDYYIDSIGSQSFIFSSTISSWNTPIYPQLVFDDANNYEVGLINLETYYSFATSILQIITLDILMEQQIKQLPYKLVHMILMILIQQFKMQ